MRECESAPRRAAPYLESAPRRAAPYLESALARVTITGGFWRQKQDLATGRMIPAQWDALNDRVPGAEPSHALENFRIAAGETEGVFHGNVWQDSDVAKWLEAASYSLARTPDPELEAKVDESIRLIARAQQPDGYLNTYFTVAAPQKRWSDLPWAHEFYCAGHMIEAAVAHFTSTGKRSLLDVVCRMADLIAREFGPGPGQRHGCCGHPEIELALFRLYRVTGEPRYKDLALYLLDQRGKDPGAFRDRQPNGFAIDIHNTRWYMQPDYSSSHAPLRTQRDAEGHAVRAMYLYAAMADACRETEDQELLQALRSLWESAVGRRMYITGGIGSQAHAERFTVDWDLPPDVAYAETCASIGLAQWAGRMTALDPDARYADIVERVLYNGALSGVSLDGTRYFYVNPLEVVPTVADARFDHAHVKTARVPWFGCACCPTNLARLIGSLGSYLYTATEDRVWVHQYAQSDAIVTLGGGAVVHIDQRTEYPWQASVHVSLAVEGGVRPTFLLRVPGWCSDVTASVDGTRVEHPRIERGYLAVRCPETGRCEVELRFGMPVRVMAADPRVRELAGKVALQRGPLVYCLEATDNGENLHEILLDPDGPMEASFDPGVMGGTVVIRASGHRVNRRPGRDEGGVPYRVWSEKGTLSHAVRLVAVPYHQWGNRQPGGEMRVWLRCRT